MNAMLYVSPFGKFGLVQAMVQAMAHAMIHDSSDSESATSLGVDVRHR